MLYLTCTKISSVDLALYGVIGGKDRVYVDCGTRRNRQKKKWEDNIKEWTGLDFLTLTRAAEDRT